jgi:glycosyltransferase involved in cell wall biosynthesis
MGVGPTTPHVLVGGLVPPGPSGMRDYGDRVAAELRSRGVEAQEWWLESDGRTFGPAAAVSGTLLRRALRVRSGSVVVWNYSPFAYAYRGLPLPGVLVGVVLRARAVPVITVLHEIAYPWGRRGLAGRVFAVAQRAALVPVLAGSSALVVTTEERARFVARYAWVRPRAPVEVVPVFSTVGVRNPPETESGRVRRIGVIGYGGDGARPDLLFRALAGHPSHAGICVVLLGAPGPRSEEGRAWMRAAERAGLERAVEFTGVLPLEELGDHFRACDLVVLVDEEGPTSRRTMLAAALAHGRPVVATDGPNRWEAAVREGAVTVVPPEAGELGRTIRRLSEDPGARAVMGAVGFAFYEREMSLPRTCDVLAGLISRVRHDRAPELPRPLPLGRGAGRRRRSC